MRPLPRGATRPLLGGLVILSLLVTALALGWLPGRPDSPAVKTAPVLAVQRDGWHVDASLPGIKRFTFVLKIEGSADVYADNVLAPYLIDPFKFGGKAVSVSARAAGRKTNPWSTAAKITVPAPEPVLTVQSDHLHVDAYLPGVKTFTFVVKAQYLSDTYLTDVTPPLVLDQAKFGGRSVSVTAQANGSKAYPWAPAQTIDVPQLKLFGISNPTGPKGAPPADASRLGVTLNRLEFTYGEDTATMDAKVAANTSEGLTPLVLLSQTSTTIPGSVLPLSGFDIDGWQSWASNLVARYGPGGTFWQGRADSRYGPTYFEILNEPYGSWFFTPPEPAAYATFFYDVVTAARKANPRAKFLLAGSPLTFTITANVSSSQSWDAMLKSAPNGPAAVQLADGVTVHPYGSFVNARGWPSAVATHNDFPQLSVWITEIGYRMGESIDGVTVDNTTQAELMQRSLVDFMKWPWARAYVWFTWFDYDDSKTGAHNWYGLVEADGTHRPAYDTYKRFILSVASPGHSNQPGTS